MYFNNLLFLKQTIKYLANKTILLTIKKTIMKIFKQISLAIVLTACTFIGCNQEEEENVTTINEETALEKPTTLLTYAKIISMLEEYDKTRLGLGFEENRMHTFNLTDLKNYITYIENLATEKNISLTGFSFIKGAHTSSTTDQQKQIGHETLLYAPSALINGKETVIDVLNSTKEHPISLKESLTNNGYLWRYDKELSTTKTALKKETFKSFAIGDNTSAKTNKLTSSKIKNMLEAYDNTFLNTKTKALGFEDARVTTFNLAEFKKYLSYVENEAFKKGIVLESISFIKGVYNEETTHNNIFIGYENLFYLPTTLINGEEVLIDLANSSKNNIVSFKDALSSNGYNWRYNNNGVVSTLPEKQQAFNEVQLSSSNTDLVSVANMTHVKPPSESNSMNDSNILMANYNNVTPPYDEE